MGQVMINFRIDEDAKKSMEQACREMGLSMTAAFTIFAKKVGKEKRIPFEITAECGASQPALGQRRCGDGMRTGTRCCGGGSGWSCCAARSGAR